MIVKGFKARDVVGKVDEKSREKRDKYEVNSLCVSKGMCIEEYF